MNFFICNYFGLEGNKIVGIIFNKLYIFFFLCILLLILGKVIVVILYCGSIWFRGNYGVKKSLYVFYIYFEEIKILRG